MNNLFDKRGAEFSEDRKYRYALWRIWDEHRPLVMYIGLNPSTAKEDKNDNTISKLEKVTKNNGYGGFYMMNLFALVSTDPNALFGAGDTMGDNFIWFDKITPLCKDVVFAWGNFKQAREQGELMKKRFVNPMCLRKNKNGSPMHPLYCLDNEVLKKY